MGKEIVIVWQGGRGTVEGYLNRRLAMGGGGAKKADSNKHVTYGIRFFLLVEMISNEITKIVRRW